MADTSELINDNALPAHLPRTALNAGLSFASLGRILDHNLGAIVSLLDLDARLHYVNARFAKSFNMTPAEMIGKSLFDLYTKEHTDAFMPFIRRAFAGEEVYYERLGPVVGSAGIWHTIAVTPWRDDTGRIIGAATSSMRVHELKVKVEALRVANERLSSHFDNSPLTVLEFDGALHITRCSAQVESLLGMAPEPLLGRSLLPVLGDDRQMRPLADAFARLQQGFERSNRVEVTLTHRNGAPVYSEWFNSALTDASGRVSSMMSLVQDVTTRTIAELQLRKFATHDPLTGLYNRRALTDRLEQAVARRKRNGTLIALLFLDLDERIVGRGSHPPFLRAKAVWKHRAKVLSLPEHRGELGHARSFDRREVGKACEHQHRPRADARSKRDRSVAAHRIPNNYRVLDLPLAKRIDEQLIDSAHSLSAGPRDRGAVPG